MDQDKAPKQNDTASNYLFVDLETGGLDAERHAILQLAAVITDLDLNVLNCFASYIKPHPDLAVTLEALAINKLNLADLESAPEESSVLNAFLHFALPSDNLARFAGYNCKFDLSFLNKMLKRHDAPQLPYRVPWLDIFDVAKAKIQFESPEKKFKLTTVAHHLGVTTAGAHDAAIDLMITIKVAKLLKELPYRNGTVVLETAQFSSRGLPASMEIDL